MDGGEVEHATNYEAKDEKITQVQLMWLAFLKENLE